MANEIDMLRAALRDRVGGAARKSAGARDAAVAAVLRSAGDDAEVLLIRRAERHGDPWSGHIAFPGGKVEPGDQHLRRTAVRETYEEVGLDLAHHEYLGFLDDVSATARGALTGMVVSPHVFTLSGPVGFMPNADEVAEVFWVSLNAMRRGELDAHKRLQRDGQELVFPAFEVGPHLVWGLTHRMLRELIALAR
ncbi:MAG: CoA pyrophosphatase [Myxococcales bacterium]|nr:CoA pyrophosphatase [Myxococcales bacterium]MDD9969661.1 CoA pyrophosphatase [Myxococcales bacterium]